MAAIFVVLALLVIPTLVWWAYEMNRWQRRK